MNFIDADARSRGLGAARSGQTVRLDLPVGALRPPAYGRRNPRHRVFAANRNEWDDALDDFYPQASSQWDSLRHVRCREFGFYGGEIRDPDQHSRLGVDAWSQGIVSRGVLVDVERFHRRQNIPFDPASGDAFATSMLADALSEQGSALMPGDVLCIRTGWTSRFKAADGPARVEALQSRFAGLSAEEESARWLWDHRVAAVISDNPAVENSPGDAAIGSLHRRLIPALGFAIGELFDLDALTEACAQRENWEFLFVGVPLYLIGGVGSPANSLAIL